MSELTLKDFKISDNGKSPHRLGFHYDLTPNGYGNWKSAVFEPTIFSQHFEFGVKYHNPSGNGYWNIGVAGESDVLPVGMSANNGNNGKCGAGATKNSWVGFIFLQNLRFLNLKKGITYGGQVYNNKIILQRGIGHLAAKAHNKTMMFTVNKIEKRITFHILENGKYELVLVENVEFPEGFKIVISASYFKEHFELVHFKDFAPTFNFRAEQVTEDEKERLDYITEGDFEMQLQNKTLKLWKPFLIHSNLRRRLEQMESCQTNLSHLSLSVDEKSILSLLLHKEVKISKDDFADYFIFFKSLGMDSQMLYILALLSKFEYEDLHHMLQSFVSKHENDTIKSWFTLAPEFKDDFSFDHSFSLHIFDHMKEKSQNIKRGTEEFKRMIRLPASNVIMYHLEIHKKGEQQHPDFGQNVNGHEEEKKKGHLFESLWKDRALSNCTLKTRDGGSFECHKEVLILKFNFIFRMIRFDGIESESLRKSGTIILEDLGGKEVENMLCFGYTGRLCDDCSMQTLILLAVHADKYQEVELMKKVLEELREAVRISEKRKVRAVVSDVGHLLIKNENICKVVIPILEKKLEESELDKIMSKSDEKRQVRALEQRVDRQQETISKQQSTIEKQQEKIDRLEKIIKKHFPDDF